MKTTVQNSFQGTLLANYCPRSFGGIALSSAVTTFCMLKTGFEPARSGSTVKIPRPDQASVELFKSLVPNDPKVTVRPMFGNLSAFVNGNMFFGLFGNDLFVRLSGPDQIQLLNEKGASNLEPMKGKPMKDYVVMPSAWKGKPETIRTWVSKSLAWSSKLPAKKPKKVLDTSRAHSAFCGSGL